MPESMITVGQVCVAIFPEDENWHRALITGVKNIDYIMVCHNVSSLQKVILL